MKKKIHPSMRTGIRPETLKRYDAIVKLIGEGATVAAACKRHRVHPSHYYLLKKKVKPLLSRQEKNGTLLEVRGSPDVVFKDRGDAEVIILRGLSPEVIQQLVREMT